MILSPGRNFVFVHIPKTGGTSMALALEDRAHKDDILIGDTPKAIKRRARLKKLSPKGRLWKHSTLADIDGILTPEELSEMFIFTLVRNPWDRMVSYYHWLRAQRFDHPAVALAAKTDFEGFVLHPQTIRTLTAAPYASYVSDAHGREQPTTFVRLEALQEDMTPVIEHLGFRPAITRTNASDRPSDYRSLYSATTAEAVAKMCATDIARFGYAFDA